MQAMKISALEQLSSVALQEWDTLYSITWQAENTVPLDTTIKRSFYGVRWNIEKERKCILHTHHSKIVPNKDRTLLWHVSASPILHDVATVQHIAKYKQEYDQVNLVTCGALSLPLVHEGPGELVHHPSFVNAMSIGPFICFTRACNNTSMFTNMWHAWIEKSVGL